MHRSPPRWVVVTALVLGALATGGTGAGAAGSAEGTFSDHVEATVLVAPSDDPVSRSLTNIAAAPNGVWVVGHRSGIVTRIDPTTNEVAATIDVPVPGCVPGGCSGLTFIGADRRSVWVANMETLSWVHIDPRTNEIVGSVPAPALVDTLAPPLLDGSDMWAVLDRAAGAIARVSGRTHEVTKTIAVDAPVFEVLARQGHDLWVATSDPATGAANLRRYDTRTGEVVLDVPDPIGGRTISYRGLIAGGDLWVSPNLTTRVVRIDGETGGTVADLDFGSGIAAYLGTGDGAVWMRHTTTPEGAPNTMPWTPQHLQRIDLRTNEVSPIALPDAEWQSGVAHTRGSLWVGDWTAGVVYRTDL